ncbi:SusC/RagA family TonB-linked outer membrane protein [Mucilaginibacter gotjawali]|uniref:TonB-linked SusC/RagA family outer membrane protein n=2 Tax=Mucilaginibacter gotjawali TaxID=1550579 RepID=A0A839S7D2_9SPHI|nr:TonB-dependent receptor [Mucilaginibacter gotjawali]MBB3053795.1 TonB-linked SusC/RagA family outer membrane protein [Mucilaginibacter gotjawali]BAU54058.1 TonB dependent receptor [Mucilaginibacter gotjawali]
MKRKLLTQFLIFAGMTLSLLVISLPGYSQMRKITGKVLGSDDGLPLPGVTIKVKGTTDATSTNIDGLYSINAAQGSTLVFSFIGYDQKEIAVPASGAVDVTLAKSTNSLNEVVVIGYGSARRKDLVGAVDVVNAKDAGANTSLSPAQLLIGKAPGVQVVQTSGVPGAGAQIIVRGVGSFTDVSPLYVIDGIQGSEGLFNQISPQDIDNITILKDAASTAIYGVAGANGVVIITTKKAKAGATQIAFTSQVGFSRIPKKLDLLKAADYVKLLTDIDVTNNNPTPVKLTTPFALVDRNDWQDQIFKTALSTQNDLTISGGGDKVTYNMSAGYVTQQATVKDYQLKRFTNRFTLEEKLGRFRFGQTFNLRYTKTEGEAVSLGNALQYAPYQPIFDSSIQGGYSILTNIDDDSNAVNPLVDLGVKTQSSHELVLFPQVFGEVKIIEGLTFRSQASMQYGSSVSDSYNIPYVISNKLFFDRQANRSFNNYYNYNIDNYFSYNRTFGKHNISLTAGTSYIDPGSSRFVSLAGTGMLNDQVKDISVATTITAASSSGYANGTGIEQSYYGRLIYSYDDKYILSASLRRDGSSNFPPASRYGNFPGGGFAWRFSQEDFIKAALPFVSDGKLRVGWGRTGNNRISLTASDVYTFNGSTAGNLVYSFGRNEQFNSGTTLTTIGNGLLHWETTDQTDAGIDLGFLNNRITLNADYYNRKSSGLLVQIPVPPSLGIGINTGGSSQTVNAADAQNKGFEFQLGYHSPVSKDFSYNVSVNGAFNTNKTISLGTQSPTPIVGGTGVAETLTKPGTPIGAYYGYMVEHVAKDQAEIDALNVIAQQKTGNTNAVYQAGLKPGDFIFKDLNGDGTVDSKDQKFLGSPIPKFMYGINIGATYHNFDLNVVLSGVQGVQIGNDLRSTLQFAGTGHNASTAILNRWEKPGDNALLPRAGQDDNGSGNLRPSNFFIDNGAYLKARNVTLGYTFTKATLQSFSGNVLSKLRIYIAAENLFTITGYKGYDPEIGSDGGDLIFNRNIDHGQLPQPRTILFGLQAGF